MLWFLALTLFWLEMSPSYGACVRVARQEAALSHRKPYSELPAGRTQTLTPAQLRKIDALESAKAHRPKPDVRVMTIVEMQRARGRGAYRNPYFNGTLPWQRSFHDVNICNGNLFKSFTDIQVAPGRGAGLVLQRTYNSNDSRIGPFGVGWTHAYDIRIQEAADVKTESGNTNVPAGVNNVERTDFFGAKHTYHRDADGLYSPPNYMFDETSSDYANVLATGPTKVMADTEKAEDGTIKHYVDVVTLADGTSGNERACDYIQDRHGNRTTLAYAQTITQPDGSTRKLLTSVTDPSGRSLAFTWTNLNAGDAQHPAWRITQVQGPLVGGSPVAGVSYKVTYEYFTSTSDPNAADNLYNLKAVHLDSDGMNRTTSYTYTHLIYNSITENALLNSVTDPLGHQVSYTYEYLSPVSGRTSPTGTIWVDGITEPAGVDSNNNPRTIHWDMGVVNTIPESNTCGYFVHMNGYEYFATSAHAPTFIYEHGYPDPVDGVSTLYYHYYDTSLNLTQLAETTPVGAANVNGQTSANYFNNYTYGVHGNVLTHSIQNFPGTETTTYYDASKYFQKQSVTDMNSHTSTCDYFDSQDPNLGNRGNVKYSRDARYSITGKQFTYTYNQYGQKTSEINENGIVTQYTYGDSYGNLTQVVQDPGDATHLNRTTTMTYDAAGHVLTSIDPNGKTSTFTYNVLGQPLTVATQSTSGASAETITYQYEGNGRTQTVTNNRGTTSISYEAGSDRVHSVTDPITGTISYTYLNTGERSTMTLPGGGTWTYAYMDADLYLSMPKDDPSSVCLTLASITDDQGRRVDYSISTGGSLMSAKYNQVFSGGNTSTPISYCQANYTQNVAVNGASYTQMRLSTVKNNWSDSNNISHPLYQNAYTYDTAGQRLTNAITNNIGASRTELYSYDELNRLSTADYGDGETQSYTFDPMGNRLTKSDIVSGTTTTNNYTCDAANRLTAVDANAYTNDANGNTLTGSGRTNVWDSQNRLVSCTTGGATTTYTYGADGLRRSATTAGVTTYYVYDGSMMVREMQKNASNILVPTATYLAGPRGPEYRRDDNASTVRWYVYDGLGSVVAEVDPNGNVTSTRKTDVYGVARGATGTATSKQGFVGSLGHLTDDTGLVYMRARYYDPVIGRFASEDPSRNGLNWYEYANDNPVNGKDMSGKSVIGWASNGLSLVDLYNVFFAYCDFLMSMMDTIRDSADVERNWGTFMATWAISILGDNSTQISMGAGLLDWGVDQLSEDSGIGGEILGTVSTVLSGAITGASLAMLCLGYNVREEYYIDQIDE
ncbi:hypothetical protein CCAX7_007900 [Capsulimonas corticalis]|uniref:Uncharacterized protein n=2 Tax=Capsulimonas corticalis TaxID=2219043 RepID=A0A402CTT5_9BACT|nr:hypothetical protein CCAX7_007900 [Capsulimonas corticalis]